MRPLKICIVVTMTLTVAACSVFKKSKPSPTPPNPPATTSVTRDPAPSIPGLIPATKPGNGVVAPGNNELTAIQATHRDVTMQTLTDGYIIYTGVCTNCHGAMNIYTRPLERWPDIIADMAPRAKLTETQKDALYKYVLAIKATQQK